MIFDDTGDLFWYDKHGLNIYYWDENYGESVSFIRYWNNLGEL
jgi:sugar lactone lactonase YvrE